MQARNSMIFSSTSIASMVKYEVRLPFKGYFTLLCMKGLVKFTSTLSIEYNDVHEQVIETRGMSRSCISDILIDSFKFEEHIYATIVNKDGRPIEVCFIAEIDSEYGEDECKSTKIVVNGVTTGKELSFDLYDVFFWCSKTC